MARHNASSSSSGSSYDSEQSYQSRRSHETDDTAHSIHQASYKSKNSLPPPQLVQASKGTTQQQHEPSPRASVETYASTVEIPKPSKSRSTGPVPRERSQCYEPEAIPATTSEFAAVFPSTRRLLIQHDDSTLDGNMNLHVDTEVTTSSGRRKKLTLFHMRMKDLQERDFSIRRYSRDSGREIVSCKKHYIKSAPTSPLSARSTSHHSLSQHSQGPAKKQTRPRADSGYASEESDDEEDERKMEEALNLMTTPAEDIVSRATDAIKLDFSNYAQVIMDRQKVGRNKEYPFEYWGHNYVWTRSKQFDDGELIYSYDLIQQSNQQKVAIIMPDALSAEEAHWEAKQGGWIPASSMRLLRSDISDDLGDVIIATGLIALTDDSMRRHFHITDRKR